MSVCSNHFTADCYGPNKYGGQIHSLKDDAVPTVFDKPPVFLKYKGQIYALQGKPSNDTSDSNNVPSIIGTSSSNKSQRKQPAKAETITSPAAGEPSEKEGNEPPQALDSPLNSEAGTSGTQQPLTKRTVTKFAKVSTETESGDSKPKAKRQRQRKEQESSSPDVPSDVITPNIVIPVPTADVFSEATTTPNVPSNEIEPVKLCVVKMEIEDDGYNDVNNEENFIASLASSSSPKSLDITTNSALAFIKTETTEEIVPNLPETAPSVPEIVPKVPKTALHLPEIVPNCPETARNIPEIVPNVSKIASHLPEIVPSNGLNNFEHPVEAFFKNIAKTVMQLPPHLIEEAKFKVSSMVDEMVIRACNEGYVMNIKQEKL